MATSPQLQDLPGDTIVAIQNNQVVGAAHEHTEYAPDHTHPYEPAGAVGLHAAAANPHTVYQLSSQKGQANGYAGLGADGKVPAAQLPAATIPAPVVADLPIGTTALDLLNREAVRVTINANITLTTTVPPFGYTRRVIVKSSGTTTRTVTLGTGFRANGTVATGTAANRDMVLQFVSDGTSLIEMGARTPMLA